MRLINQHKFLFCVLGAMLVVAFVVNLSMGSLHIPFSQIIDILLGKGAEKVSWEYIILNYRLPKALTAIMVGLSLSVCGMLMQTLFRNPMAESYVLGLSSGASLGVAIIILGAGFLPLFIKQYLVSAYAVVIASVMGSLIVLIVVLLVSRKVKDSMTLLIIGLMFASFTGAIVGVLSYFSTAEELQKYTFWALGSLGNQSWSNIAILFGSILTGAILSFLSLKTLNALLLGENYARSMGINIKKSRYIIIIATGILSGACTAFVGPVAFVGLAVPHISRMLFKTSNHFILFFANCFLGALVLLICDSLCQLPGEAFLLPINAVTSMAGAPVVIWLLINRKSIRV